MPAAEATTTDRLADEPVPAQAPSSEAAVRRGYLDQAAIGYVIYGVGAVAAFIGAKLALTDAQIGLHSSALAVGTVLAGLSAHRLDLLAGVRRTHVVGLSLLALAALLLAWAPGLWATLAGGAAVGLGTGLLLGHINQVMTAGGGALGRVRLARSTLVAILSSVTVPVFIGIGVAIGIGWELALIPALGFVSAGLVATRGFEERPLDPTTGRGRLSREYWTAWALVVSVVAAEFATVFWLGSLVELRTGVSLETATLGLSVLLAGFIVGRVGLSTHALGRVDPVWLLRAAIGLAAIGLIVPWVSTSYELSMVGVLVAGIGLSMLYPPAAAMMLATAPRVAGLASSRLVLATGVAMLLSPLVLGLVADVAELALAWALVPGVCVVAALLTVPVARDRRRLRLTSAEIT